MSCSAHNDGLLAICLVLRLRVLHLCQGNLSLESMETTKKITSWHHVDSGERRGGTKGGCFLEFMPCCWGIFSLLTCFVRVSFFLFFLGFFFSADFFRVTLRVMLKSSGASSLSAFPFSVVLRQKKVICLRPPYPSALSCYHVLRSCGCVCAFLLRKPKC